MKNELTASTDTLCTGSWHAAAAEDVPVTDNEEALAVPTHDPVGYGTSADHFSKMRVHAAEAKEAVTSVGDGPIEPILAQAHRPKDDRLWTF